MSGMTNAELAQVRDEERMDEAERKVMELRRQPDRGNPGNAIRNEIAAQRAADNRRDPTAEHDDAVHYFDRAYTDLTHNPQVLNEVTKRHNLRAIQAAEKGERVDWTSELSKIGEGLRKELGLPGSDEKRRQEFIAGLRKARGQE